MNAPQSFDGPAAGEPAQVQWIGYHLNQAAGRIRASTSAALQPLGLTPPQLRALETVSSEQPLTQARLGQLTATDRTTIVALVDRLEAIGAVKRSRDDSDRRSHALILTPAGDRLLAEARRAARSAEDDFLASLTPAERSDLKSLLLKIHRPRTCKEEEKR